MIKLLLRQIFFIVTTFFGVTIVTFSLIYQSIPETVAERTESVEAQYLEVSEQSNYLSAYASYLTRLMDADLGITKVNNFDVFEDFLTHLPASIELIVLALLIAVIIGLPLGMLSALRSGTGTDVVINNSALLAYSMPIFWWGILLIMLFSINLDLTPVAGRLSYLFDIEPVTGFMLIDTLISDSEYRIQAFQNALLHLSLPVFALATFPLGIIIKMTRTAMLETISQDYMSTAKAKGISWFRIYWIHALRSAMLPIINVLGLQISSIITSAILTEYLFSWPGIGKWLLDVLQQRDFLSLSGGILITTTLIIFINAIIEVIQYWLNPKIMKREKVYSA
jgi:dipeptide transport system permease protein